MTDMQNSGRNADGTFAAGNNANADGVNGHLAGYQRKGDRAVRLAQIYTTKQIIEFSRNERKRQEELSFWDAETICAMALTITGEAEVKLKASKELHDRVEGKSVNTVVLKDTAKDRVPMTQDDMMLDCAKRIAFILARGMQVKELKSGTIIDQPPSAGVPNGQSD